MRKSDRDAIILLVLVLIVAVVLFPFLGKEQVTPSPAPSDSRPSPSTVRQPPLPLHGERVPLRAGKGLFYFDPNTADSLTFLRLGLRPWQAHNIIKYRARGGRYRYKEDFARLYGLTLEKYRQLEPYIRITPEVMAADVIKPHARSYSKHSPSSEARPAPSDSRPLSEARPLPLHGGGGGRGFSHSSPSTVRQPPLPLHGERVPLRAGKGSLVDINTADTTQLKRIPGIGSYFARRIVELRSRRQAFVSPEELLSIRNFPETAIAYMTASQHFPTIHINKADLSQLKSHPLINHTQATDILTFRRTNGPIHSVRDISMLPSFTKEQLTRLTPFLLFD